MAKGKIRKAKNKFYTSIKSINKNNSNPDKKNSPNLTKNKNSNTNFKTTKNSSHHGLTPFKSYSNKKNQKNQTKLNKKEQIYPKESLAILNYIKESNDVELSLIYYFLFIKGLNFTAVSRILLTNFKNGFDFLLIKKGKCKIYKIDKRIQPKFLEFMNSQNYVNKYFFLNEIKDSKNARRASILKDKFKTIISDCISIREERKNKILSCLSSMRNVKWGFDLDFFFNNIHYTFGYFEPELSIFSNNEIIQKIDNDKNEKTNKEKSINNEFKYNSHVKENKEKLPINIDNKDIKINLLEKFENDKKTKNIFISNRFSSSLLSELNNNINSLNDFPISPINSYNNYDI